MRFHYVSAGTGLAVALLFGTGCSRSAPTTPTTAPAPPVANGPGVRVLFLGNSHTAVNDVPGLVTAMAAAGGVTVQARAETPGGFSLEDHWNRPESQAVFASQKWDFVVLQQGPSSRAASQVEMKTWAGKWGEEIRKAGAVPVLYMVWPVQAEPQMFGAVSKSYRAGAVAAGGKVAAGGEVWAELRKEWPDAPLYSDDLHASPLGSYLAALVLTHRLTGVTPDKVPARIGSVEIPADRLDAVRRAAKVVIDRD